MMSAPAVVLVPPTASAAPVVLDRFTDGSAGARLDFSAHAWNDTLAVELPRGARIDSAELAVTGVEGSSIGSTTVDLGNTKIGDDLWALSQSAIDIYPPTVDPYASGWDPITATDVKNVEADDASYWYTMTGTPSIQPPWPYPLQMLHFHPNIGNAEGYEVHWNGYGTCSANDTNAYQAELWLYNHTGSSWEMRASYGSDDSGDVWLNSSFLPGEAFVSANGSVDAIVAGPHMIVDLSSVPPKVDLGHLYTDYVALDVGTAGTLEYPPNATLWVGGARMNLSAGPLVGQVDVGPLGLKDALQSAVDAEVVMPGTVVIPLNVSVGWRTLSGIDVGGLRIEYEPAVNAPPAWRGPAAVEVEEDSQWTEALDLGEAFSDDYNQAELRFALVGVSDPANLSARMQFGTSGNWTLAVRPAPDFFGEVAVTVNATDMFGESTGSPPLAVRVLQTPDRPVIDDPGELQASENVRFRFTLTARDPDMPDDVLAWSDASEVLDVNSTTGAIDWTPGKDQIGRHRIPVTVTDRFGLQGVATITIAVANSNDPPVITSPLALEVDQDQAVSYDIVATDPDTPFGDVLSFYAFSEDIEVVCDMATGRVTFTPTNADVGELSVLLRAQDRSGLKDDRTLAVTVRNLNDPPVLQDVAPQTHDQGEQVSLQLLWSDPDLSVAGAGERLTLTSDGPAWLRPDASGLVSFTADQSMVGVWTVNYTVTDALGLLDAVRVVWTIIDVNDPPVISTQVPAIVTATEDVAFAYQLEATDLDGDPVAWEDDTTLFDIGGSDGRISFLPTQTDVGTHRVTVTVSDGKGGRATVTFDLVVANVNDAPVVRGVAPLNGTRFAEGEAIALQASATDADGDALTFIWREGGRELGRGGTFTTDRLRPGRHTITLAVTDGNATVERLLELEVRGKERGVPVVAILLVVAVLAAVVAALLAMRRRGGAQPAVAAAPSPPAPAGAPEGEAPKEGAGDGEPQRIEVEYREV